VPRRKKPSELPTPAPVEPPVVPAPPVNPVPPPVAEVTASQLANLDGVIVARNPGDRPFGLLWSNITRWRAEIERACAEFGTPVARVASHIVIESHGNRKAVQENDQNGWSYGLMQVVPRWHGALIRRLSGSSATNEATLGQLLIDDPLLAIRCGCAILASLYKTHGSWDKASSAFFLGNPDWRGADTVNGNTGEGYRRSLNALIAEIEGTTPKPEPEPTPTPTLPWPAKWITLAGTTTPIPIPADCEFIIDLTPVGPNRPGRSITTTGMTWHQTGNVSVGANAVMHSNWQDAGTPGHPDGKVGVHFYVDDSRIIQKIPIGENSIHSGDWRNNAHVSMEECINADRNSAKTERNAMALAAGIVGSVLDSTAKDDLYPHGNAATGCPKFYMSSGRWPSVEASTDNLIRIVKGATPGPTPEPEPTYAAAVPVPKDWDGTDWKREDGALFIALRRVFVAAADSVTCHQSADSGSPEVRRALNRGEAFEAFYVVRGSDLRPWLVSRWGSRIQADLCEPGLDEIFDAIDDASLDDPGDAVTRPILIDPTAGLSAQTVAEDSPQLTKDEFIAGGG
jgi:hypothetical protein